MKTLAAAVLAMSIAGPVSAKNLSMSPIDMVFEIHMSGYCPNDMDKFYSDPTVTAAVKMDFAKTVISDWMAFRKRHPAKGQSYEQCISRTWLALKKYGLDGFVEPYPTK